MFFSETFSEKKLIFRENVGPGDLAIFPLLFTCIMIMMMMMMMMVMMMMMAMMSERMWGRKIELSPLFLQTL